ncbi:hypothetical protein ACIBBE_46600 [Streptomyces sp. NPDC051644]|uniref:hypothetical protein n=1 Tax=Streptomyces sp. NPDC051644 TaxID=3365666 RepID=UPI003798452B
MSDYGQTGAPSPYEQLLNVLGDSDASRELINDFARSLAVVVQQAEESQWPGPISALVDPYQHTRETWSAATRCPAIAKPFEKQPDPPVGTTVEYFLQTQQPDESWEQSSSSEGRVFWAADRLMKMRRRMPQFEHRIVQRTTSVRVQPIGLTPAEETTR